MSRTLLTFGPAAVVIAVAAAVAPATAQPIAATYTVQAAGMGVMEVQAVLHLTENGYSTELRTRLRGVGATLGSGGGVTRVNGTWSSGGAQPVRFASEGVWRGEERRTVVEYPNGQPTVRVMLPANNTEREPVPEAAQRGTVDNLSAFASLIRDVQRSGRCDSTARVYDGRRLTEMSARTEGLEQFPPVRGEWSGRALKCRFEGRMTSGFRREDGPEARQPQGGVAWIAEVSPGLPPIPVRIEVPTRWFGTLSVRLVSFGPVGQQQAAR